MSSILSWEKPKKIKSTEALAQHFIAVREHTARSARSSLELDNSSYKLRELK